MATQNRHARIVCLFKLISFLAPYLESENSLDFVLPSVRKTCRFVPVGACACAAVDLTPAASIPAAKTSFHSANLGRGSLSAVTMTHAPEVRACFC